MPMLPSHTAPNPEFCVRFRFSVSLFCSVVLHQNKSVIRTLQHQQDCTFGGHGDQLKRVLALDGL